MLFCQIKPLVILLVMLCHQKNICTPLCNLQNNAVTVWRDAMSSEETTGINILCDAVLSEEITCSLFL